MQGSFFKWSFVAGYAGHVPRLNEMFGISTGKMVNLLNTENGVNNFHSGQTIEKSKVKKIKHKWLGVITGYMGHLRGVKAENMFGKD